jgi:Ca2+-binding EF-hand superfamily protein
MRKIAVILGAALLAASTGAAAQDGSQTGIHPPAKPLVPRALSREGIDKTVERMFEGADSNNDGTITLAEFNANVDARKNRVIAERFQRIDTDHDQQISAAEFAAWQRSIGSVALSDRLDTPQTEGLVAENLPIDYGRKDDVDFMQLVLEPLNATMIVAANADYDAGTSLAELLDYERGLFDKADTNKDGFITWDEADNLRKKN